MKKTEAEDWKETYYDKNPSIEACFESITKSAQQIFFSVDAPYRYFCGVWQFRDASAIGIDVSPGEMICKVTLMEKNQAPAR